MEVGVVVGRIANGGRPLAGDTRVAAVLAKIVDDEGWTDQYQVEAILPFRLPLDLVQPHP
jgi:hypothetical protein